MSLLMDALKKAEQAKRNAEVPPASTPAPEPTEAAPAAEPEIELELSEAYLDALEEATSPVAAGTAPVAPAPARELSTELAPPPPPAPPHVDAEPARVAPVESPPEPPSRPAPVTPPRAATTSTPAASAEPAPSAAHQRWAARTVFVAKENSGGDRRRVIFYGALGLLALATAGVYLYVYNASMAGNVSSLAPPVASAPVEALPPEETAPSQPPASAPVIAETERARPAAEVSASQGAPIDGLPISIKRREVAPRTDKQIADAYTAYQRGDVDRARRLYWETLRSEPNNRNALLGAAAISAKNGEQAQARELYLRLLDRDPNDPLALAGLLNLEEPADPRATESRVKGLLVNHPDAAHLHGALGNIYAREERWAEAREAYAKALALDERDSLRPEEKNPDFAFNLAVAQEHLGQNDDALEHYRAALAYARWRRPDFDPAVAEARVRALSNNTGP